MPDQDPVVWPDDPVEADAAAAEADPAKSTDPSWPSTFGDALKQSQAASEQPPAAAPAPAAIVEPAAPAPVHEYPTQPSMPAITAAKTEPPAPAEPAAKTVPPEPAAKTVPPEPAKTVPPEPAVAEEPAPVLGTADELPTSTFKTPIPAPAEVSASNGADSSAAEPVAEAAPEPGAEPEPEPEPVKAAEPEPEVEPVKAPEAEPEPEPVKEPEPAPEPAKAAEPEPPKPAEPQPEPAAKEEEWVPLPENPPVPAWAPKLGAPAAAAAEKQVDWGASNPLPAWAPIGGGRPTANMPAATRISSTPDPASAQPPKPAAPAAAASSQPPAAAARASQPPAAEGSKPKTSSWEIVPPKVDQPKQAYVGPSAEDKSYAEWFAWAKRSGAPAGACHAAAQGAFRALSAGHDMNTAVQWATAAMGSPPGLVSASRQLYCAWYSLGNIDLKLPSPQAHAFAAGAIAALDSGADAPTAHQAGLAAAGIIG